METRKLITSVEIAVGSLLLIFIAYGYYLGHFVNHEAFWDFVREDGPVEYPTALFLFFCSLIGVYRVYEYRTLKKPLWLLTWGAMAFLFFFAAGEEISWGQRIFGIESSEFFLEHNKQAETNLHNLIVGGQNINILIFSRLMFVVLIVYFVFSHLLVKKVAFVRRLVNQFRVPLPKTQHLVLMAVSTVMVLLIGLKKESELHELSFAFVFFLIFLNPFKVAED
ncbi:hypothetical protein [Sunxiuqinia sp. sy24]|uniref:hypothetical protein n=1 Tax=Sunxiuqinia sp. sy24 TaxID=3461495 RepID=UPI00404623F7